jgi:hypothetical protein
MGGESHADKLVPPEGIRHHSLIPSDLTRLHVWLHQAHHKVDSAAVAIVLYDITDTANNVSGVQKVSHRSYSYSHYNSIAESGFLPAMLINSLE